MLTVNPDIGVPPWLKLAEEIPSWEQKAYEFVARMKWVSAIYYFFVLKSIFVVALLMRVNCNVVL